MPTPLPSIDVPDNMPTLNAYRVGQQDRIAADERSLLKQAGGLAAAGNYKGAQSALYAGGNFGEARNVAGELRAQSAEGRAQSSHLSAMKDHQLERASKVHELFGRLIPTIKTPEQLEMAKNLIKQRTGQDFSGVTMESLPMYHQENISTQQQIENELANRKNQAEQARASLGQSNKDREYDLDARKVDILSQRANAAGSKAAAGKPLTEAQGKAFATLKIMEDAEKSLGDSGMDMETGESPMGRVSSFMSENAPADIAATLRNKKQNQYFQATDNWSGAKLRLESGATIGRDEIRRDARTFWPVPGDDIQTRRNKAKARKARMEGLRAQASNTGSVETPTPISQGNDLGHLSDEDILRELSK